MNFDDIPNYGKPSVKRTVANAILSESDTVEMLNEEGFNIDIEDLLGTEYEDMIPAFISVQSGESWGMYGQIFKFKLTDELKNHILRAGLDGNIYGWWKSNNCRSPIFQNFTLLKGEKVIYSCCTHEIGTYSDMVKINDELAPKILQAVKKLK